MKYFGLKLDTSQMFWTKTQYVSNGLRTSTNFCVKIKYFSNVFSRNQIPFKCFECVLGQNQILFDCFACRFNVFTNILHLTFQIIWVEIWYFWNVLRSYLIFLECFVYNYDTCRIFCIENQYCRILWTEIRYSQNVLDPNQIFVEYFGFKRDTFRRFRVKIPNYSKVLYANIRFF